MSQSEIHHHPVLAAVTVVEEALAEIADVDPVWMATGEKAQALLGVSTAIDRLTELQLRLLASADDVAAEEGARDAAAWLAQHGRRDRGECRRRLRLARALQLHAPTAEALRDGRMCVAQAQAVVDAVDELPIEVEPEVRGAAERRLVQEAETFAPRQLRILSRRVVDVVAPDLADDLEGRLLEREERRAAQRTHLYRRRNGDGTSDLRIRAADAVCDRLLTYLHAFTSPRRSGVEPAADRRPYPQQLGTAFASFLEAVDPARLPLHGGDATTVLVTVSLDALRDQLGTAYVGDEPLPASEARRLACTAAIVPAVLDGASQVLDLGRSRRLFSPAQRKALAVSQPTCRADGCDVPAAWTEAHHAGNPWARGGRTDLADGLLLCGHHHRRAHDRRYRTDRMADGRVRFHRRT